ncbi:tetratricopeptide repeat protein [Oxalobacteraceae bacterium OTU3CAMAD1]|nr:tetratricopeptide repeat protein [Oxalobacteraceae bacterium OTU3CAMAD1]
MTTDLIFLQRLSLDGDADERAIRRAYARELKLIDQEADPAGFQSLREAYDTALYWVRHKEEFEDEELEDYFAQPELGAAVGQDLAQPARMPPPVPSPRPPEHPAADPAPTLPQQEQLDTDHEALAEAVFADFLQRAATIPHERPVTPDVPWRRELRASLDDPRLINIIARETFERHVADLLVSGWRPGHESLLVAAVNTFGWSDDRRRVFSLGRSGAMLDAAIDERATFDLQPDAQRDAQRQLIERLRDPKHPGTREIVRNSATLETLIARFPNWLALVTDVDNVVRWREQNGKLPAWRRKLTFTGLRKPADHAYEHQKKGIVNWGWVIVLALVALIRFLAHDGSGNKPPSTPDPAIGYYNRGMEHLEHGDAKSAIESFTRALELKPNDAAARANRAAAYIHTDQYRRASEDLDKLAALDASSPALYAGRGMLALSTGHYDEAIAAFTKSLELAANNDYVLMHRAQAYEKKGELNKALADIDKLLSTNKKSGSYPYMVRIRIYRTQSEHAKAIAQIEPMLAADPENPVVYTMAADLHMRLNQRQQAMAILNRGVVAAPDASIYLYRAQLRPRSDKQGRKQDIDSGLALEPHATYANLSRAELESDSGQYNDAINTLTKVLNDDKADGSLELVLVHRGIAHMKMGNQALAKADFDRARAAAKTPGQLNNVAWELASRNLALPTAMAIVDEAIGKESENYAILDSKAFILLRLGRYKESVAQYDAALKHDPNGPSSLFGRGIAKRRSGQTAAGDADLNAARAAKAYVDTEFAEMGIVP